MSKQKSYDWNSLRSEFQSSELSYAAFAKSKGIPASTAYGHLKDIIAAKMTATEESKVQNEVAPQDETTFVALDIFNPDDYEPERPDVTFIKSADVANGSKATQPIELKVSNISLMLNAGFDKTCLKDVLEVILEIC